ncbi:MAG: tetratricopeptide repeat protein [Tannerella sp.]|jgi:tetratricopeptide (TPR) repeat protein|nr:tetratricopeptide repeat protein [Tannerella sp.]
MGLFSSFFSPAKTTESDEQQPDMKNFELLKYDGIRALRIGQPAYALKCFTGALKIQKDPETMRYLVTACNSLDEHELALETLNELVATGDEPANSLLMRAHFLYTQEQYAEAAVDCGQIIELEPDNHPAYYLLAKSELALEESAKAIESLDRATGIKDDYAECYALRAEIYQSIGKNDDALKDIEKAIELTPEDETAYLLRGRIHEQIGNFESAYADFLQALELNPFNTEAYLAAGRLLTNQGKYDEAIALFEEAEEHVEPSAQVYTAKALAKRQSGDEQGAIADEEKAKSLASDEEEDESDAPKENPGFENLYKGGIYG